MASDLAVRVEGLADLRRDFGRLSKALQDDFRDEIKAVADIVAVESRAIAKRKGLHDTGRLIRSIKPGTSGAVGVVRANAARKGYRYGAVYEFGRGGKRAFLRPALESKRDEVVEAFGDLLDDMHERIGRFRGPDD